MIMKEKIKYASPYVRHEDIETNSYGRFTLGNRAPVPSGQYVGWSQNCSGTGKEERILDISGNRTLVVNSVTSHFID
jgi:hypothetical protein